MSMIPLIDAVITADEIEIDEDGADFFAVIPFADDENGAFFASLECKAIEVEFEGKTFFEFCFYISLTPMIEDDDEITDIWTPEAARPYIPQSVRELLLPIVGEAYKKLIEHLDRP